MAPADLYARVIGEPMSSAGRELLGEGAWSTFACDLHRGRTPIGRPASQLLCRLARRPSRTRAGLLLAALAPTGALPTEPMADAFNRMLGGAWPDRTLWVGAIELDNGDRVILGPDGGPARSTSARPSPPRARCRPSSGPVVVAGLRLVDGGLYSPANADVLADALNGSTPP